MEDFGRRKPDPDFIIRLVETDIRPWKVPMRALARALQAIQRLVDQREDEDERDDRQEDSGVEAIGDGPSAKSLRLVDVRSSSAAYGVAAPLHDQTLQVIRDTGSAILHPAKSHWSSSSLSAVKDLSEIARSLHCEIEFRLPGSGKSYGEVLAKISPSTYDEITPTVFIRGDTSIFAKIERVGGATEMHCGIRLPDQPRKMVICHVVGAELVRQLGQYMYQHVLLSGQATWLRYGGQLKYFTVTSFEPPKTGSIRVALDRIYEAGGKAWDGIDDPDAAIAELRG